MSHTSPNLYTELGRAHDMYDRRSKTSKESQAGTTLGKSLKDPFGSLLSLQEEEVAVG